MATVVHIDKPEEYNIQTPVMSSNVDALIDRVYSGGYIRHNKYSVNMSFGGNNYIYNEPAYAIRIPGWDIATVTEASVARDPKGLNSGASIKNFPYRKNWRQELFITFFMSKSLNVFDFVNRWANSVAAPAGPRPHYDSQVSKNYLEVKIGVDSSADEGGGGSDKEADLTYVFSEVFPRVVYPI